MAFNTYEPLHSKDATAIEQWMITRAKNFAQNAEVLQAIRTSATAGNGTEENPHRIIHQYWSLDGNLLAVRDEWLDSCAYSASRRLYEQSP